MLTFPTFVPPQYHRLVEPLGIALAAITVLFVLRGLLLRSLRSSAKRGASTIQHNFLLSLRTPSFFWVLAVGLYLGVVFSDLNARYSRPIIQSIYVLLAISITVVAANLASSLLRNFYRTADGTQIRSGLAFGIVRGIVLVLGTLVIFAILGVPITPVLTALGVGGLAVALALKDTLENLFAGIYLITDGTVRVGDVVRVESGQEGTVDDIGWRSTRIRNANNTVTILPNIKLSQGILTNFSLPDRKLSASIAISVALDSDLEKVESIFLGVLRAATEDVTGVLSVPEPLVRIQPASMPLGIEYVVSFHVREYSDLGFTQHEIKKRILRELRGAGIVLAQTRLSL